MRAVAPPALACPDWLSIVDESVGRQRMIDAYQDETLSERAYDLVHELRSRGDLHECKDGSYRRGFIWGDVVIKAPRGLRATPYTSRTGTDRERCDDALLGISSSLFEASDHSSPGPVAARRIVWHESGLPIVIMERVLTRDEMVLDHRGHLLDEPDPRASTTPDWADYIDGGQVGWSPSLDGWVVYDAGCVPCSCAAPPMPSWWTGGLG